jgi:GNAT superfamily N-acetyltransferase
MDEITLRQLQPNEFEAAYHILIDVTDWLLANGIQQWQKPLPREVYLRRHAAGQNYGFFVDESLAAVVSLIPNYRVAEWDDDLPTSDYVWLGTLATAPRFIGRGLGRGMLHKIEEMLRQRGVTEIWLDCAVGEGTLPRFYQSAGYRPLLTKNVQVGVTPLVWTLFSKKIAESC